MRLLRLSTLFAVVAWLGAIWGGLNVVAGQDDWVWPDQEIMVLVGGIMLMVFCWAVLKRLDAIAGRERH